MERINDFPRFRRVAQTLFARRSYGTAPSCFEQGGDSNYAAAMSAITVAITIVLMLLTNFLAPHLPSGVLPWRD